MTAGSIVKFGRWNGLVLANFIVCLSVVAQVLGYKIVGVFNIGRFLYGFGVGLFSVFSNQFVSEIAPREISGPAGSIFQVTVVCGQMIPAALGLKDVGENEHELQVTMLTAMLLTPAAISVIQLLLLFLVFRTDTPIYYN